MAPLPPTEAEKAAAARRRREAREAARAARAVDLSEAVKHALSGADLHQRDATGRTALELAVEAEKRDTALALLLIATAKFTKPLPSPLPVPLLQRLQGWLGQAGAEKENAMGVLLQQYQGHLARGPALPADVPPQIAAAVVEMLAWAARHGLCALIDRLVEVCGCFLALLDTA